ncbi:MAG: glycosyltransferase [Syntrophobacteraceae bacterium]|nr:glycosyltransferase [Syntrophobacteraceae bacterium]
MKEKTLRFSVIVPAYNAQSTLPGLLDSLSHQGYREDFEVIVVDDCSTDSTSDVCRRSGCKVACCTKNSGPARCRNLGAAQATGEFLIFTDSDCIVSSDWLQCFDRAIDSGDSAVIMGKLVLLPSTVLGEAISALGFPAGGSLGFEKIWRVSEEGYTHSLSSCNFAIKRDIFLKLGGFDESFPYAGGEDSFLAYQLLEAGYRIKYCPEIVAYHPARKSFTEFVRWQFRRGISSLIFARKVTKKDEYISLRLWSTKNVIKYNLHDRKFPLILLLLGLSFAAQMSGFLFAKYKFGKARACEC